MYMRGNVCIYVWIFACVHIYLFRHNGFGGTTELSPPVIYICMCIHISICISMSMIYIYIYIYIYKRTYPLLLLEHDHY